MYCTLIEWNRKGRQVKRGEKSILFCPIQKKALFERSQTKKFKNYRSYKSDYDSNSRPSEYIGSSFRDDNEDGFVGQNHSFH